MPVPTKACTSPIAMINGHAWSGRRSRDRRATQADAPAITSIIRAVGSNGRMLSGASMIFSVAWCNASHPGSAATKTTAGSKRALVAVATASAISPAAIR